MRGYSSIIRTLRAPLTLGSESQSFIGAQWIVALLRTAPKAMRRDLALRVLSWSPHYFYRDSDGRHRGHSLRQFLESEASRNRESRKKIARMILCPALRPTDVVVDYGCGPGFLASAVSPHVKTVFGIDVSRGVLECARIVNSERNITYLHSSEITQIEDGSADLVYSFAVIQHVPDVVLDGILSQTHRMLKPDGRILFHVVIDAPGWRTESEWISDKSITGRARLRYGLNCFSRDAQSVRQILEARGFSKICVQPIRAVCPEDFDDVCRQHFVTAVKAANGSSS